MYRKAVRNTKYQPNIGIVRENMCMAIVSYPRFSWVTENVLALDVKLYEPACETGCLHYIKKNYFTK